MTENYMVQTLISEKEKNKNFKNRKKIFFEKNHVRNKFTLIKVYFNNSILYII